MPVTAKRSRPAAKPSAAPIKFTVDPQVLSLNWTTTLAAVQEHQQQLQTDLDLLYRAVYQRLILLHQQPPILPKHARKLLRCMQTPTELSAADAHSLLTLISHAVLRTSGG